LKKGTHLPRQLINDVTIMTLKNFWFIETRYNWTKLNPKLSLI
jgi:hypothetical protein